MKIKISKIENRDQKEAYQFCQSIFMELSWNGRFNYGLKNLKEFFSNPGEVFFLAKEGKKIIACAGLKKLSDTEALLKRFYVAEDFRGKGLADLMLEKVKKFAKGKKYKNIVLDAYHNNPRAKKFFQRHSFLLYDPPPYEVWPESEHPEIFEFRKLNLNS